MLCSNTDWWLHLCRNPTSINFVLVSRLFIRIKKHLVWLVQVRSGLWGCWGGDTPAVLNSHDWWRTCCVLLHSYHSCRFTDWAQTQVFLVHVLRRGVPGKCLTRCKPCWAIMQTTISNVKWRWWPAAVIVAQLLLLLFHTSWVWFAESTWDFSPLWRWK